MFGNKKCSHCNNKIEKKFDFCPYCASPLNIKKDYGLLGNNDNVNELNNMLFSGGNKSTNSFFDKMFSSAFKMIEKEIQKISREQLSELDKSPNMELFINGQKINLPANVKGVQIDKKQTPVKKKQTKIPTVSDETLKSSVKLPRKEPKTKLIRTADKLIYEFDTPGLDSLNKVLISNLENSLEIRAYTDKVVFCKTLPIKLPLIQYSINPVEGKLILEFKTE
ncbi:MAG: zinc ribbon domain-containing protein [archaeon]|nr:zinc ribbon domain-containing protein [archaeon]